MQSLRFAFALSAVFVTFVVSLQGQSQTDAQADGLAGPVKSVSTTITQSAVKWQQPGGPTMVEPIRCRDCEYDPDGAKTKFGQLVEGKFIGEVIRLIRDSNGQVTDRFSYDAATRELHRHDIMGPFGKTEQKVYIAGKLRFRSTFSYDQYGHLSDWLSFDAAGKPEGRTFTVTDKEGTLTHRSVYGKGGKLSYEQTFDPETQADHLTTFDEFGNVKLTLAAAHGKLASFWEPPDSPSQFGEGFVKPAGEGSVDNYACHSDLSCEISHVHYEYLNGDKHTPRSAEWRDSDGNLKLAAYFDYKVDAFGNWTDRRVWVWSPGLGERTLYETDLRAVAYWK
jgi:hypothetical protein